MELLSLGIGVAGPSRATKQRILEESTTREKSPTLRKRRMQVWRLIAADGASVEKCSIHEIEYIIAEI
ncbi:hypothetical protein X777_15113 [Ooceraea biroi]|uniref:Uncharacterized protein n=1 Tax=Ooceraea biroi TaxID=2015173 RepID=A0A026WWU1_OOCBI|nr:hypothetical protein X777_15113 [Ooceraea biroi]